MKKGTPTKEAKSDVGGDARLSQAGSWLVFAVAAAIGLSFAYYTNHAWEDFYITYRSSKNLAVGNGLVFTANEEPKVHAFTSPVNVLLPAAFRVFAGNSADETSDEYALWLYRFACIAAFSTAAVLLYRIAKAQSMRQLAIFVLLGMFVTDAKIVDFTINGQETGFMMLFLAMSLQAMLMPVRRPAVQLGLAWTGLLWTRPDGCVYIAILAASFWLFRVGPTEAVTRRELLKGYFMAGLLAAALYAPWVIWAWSYYGSPIPNTVIAKGLDSPTGPVSLLLRSIGFMVQLVGADFALQNVFAPIYHQIGGWPNAAINVGGFLAWLAVWYWVLPFGNRRTRAFSFAFFLGTWYLNVVTTNQAPWYFPNIAILAICVLGQMVDQASDVLDVIRKGLGGDRIVRQLQWFYRGFAVAIPSFMVIMLLASALELRIQQQVIENDGRKKIGEWLRDHAKSPKETVLLEPLGYIGYYSQLKMYDFPGLSSQEVVDLRRRDPKARFVKVIQELHPTWLVLRPVEAMNIDQKAESILRDEYQLMEKFDVSALLDKYPLIPGSEYVRNDQTFYIFRRIGT